LENTEKIVGTISKTFLVQIIRKNVLVPEINTAVTGYKFTSRNSTKCSKVSIDLSKTFLVQYLHRKPLVLKINTTWS
jgi:hypothetical protein